MKKKKKKLGSLKNTLKGMKDVHNPPPIIIDIGIIIVVVAVAVF